MAKACGLLLMVPTAIACNGDGAFCSLPFTKFTFPGSHNSGSFNLNIPPMITEEDVPGVDVNNVLSCFFDTHHMNYLEQLNFGVRLFNADLCTRYSGEPYTLYDCHSNTGTNEAGMGWGTVFNESLDVFRDWLSLNPRELVVLFPGNIHSTLDFDPHWFHLMAERFDECVELNEETKITDLPTKSKAGCVRVTGVPSDNITMGSLIDRNLRVMAYAKDNLPGMQDTYGDMNPGASAADLLEVLADIADGKSPVDPSTPMIVYQMIGSAVRPDFSGMSQCNDIDLICKTAQAKKTLNEMDLACVESMATRYNNGLMQDDSHPYLYYAEKECPDSPCGCRGYQSPLEPVHQKLLDNGLHLFAIYADYHELGERQSIVQVTRRMNFANLRRWMSEPEPVKDWWECNWPMVLGVALPSVLVSCCCIYALLICCFPERYGLWIRRAWERHQDRKAQRRLAREEGREEARAYLREVKAQPQSLGVTSVAPPAAVAVPSHPNGFYQAKETE